MPKSGKREKVEDRTVAVCDGCGVDVKVFHATSGMLVYCRRCGSGRCGDSGLHHLCDGGEKFKGEHTGVKGHKL